VLQFHDDEVKHEHLNDPSDPNFTGNSAKLAQDGPLYQIIATSLNLASGYRRICVHVWNVGSEIIIESGEL
jgi:hypothetical protein